MAGLFILVDAAAVGWLGTLAGDALDGAGVVRAGVVGAVAANLLNNLPAFLLLEPVTAGGALPALLVGVNLGPNLAGIGSLTTLLWLALLRSRGLAPSGWSYLRWGLLVTPATLVPALAALALAG